MIHTTSNYEQFDFNELNRGVDDAHVRRLTKNIKVHGLVQPIIVTASGHIIDGQHRFHACRELGLPLQYIIRDEMEMSDVVQLNNMSKPWSVMDKVESFAAQGNQNYIKLLEFHAECKEVDPKFSIRSASFLAQGSSAHSNKKNGTSLGGGTWRFRSSKEDALKRLFALSQFKRFPFYLNNNFVTAFLRCMRTVEDFDWKELLKKAEMNPHLFIHAGTTQEYMRMFEVVYNYKKRSHLRFF
jgi:hypothetical protein